VTQFKTVLPIHLLTTVDNAHNVNQDFYFHLMGYRAVHAHQLVLISIIKDYVNIALQDVLLVNMMPNIYHTEQ